MDAKPVEKQPVKPKDYKSPKENRYSLCWPKFSHAAGFAKARIEASKTNKEVKLKKLKVELVPCYKWRSTIPAVEGSALQRDPGPRTD